MKKLLISSVLLFSTLLCCIILLLSRPSPIKCRFISSEFKPDQIEWTDGGKINALQNKRLYKVDFPNCEVKNYKVAIPRKLKVVAICRDNQFIVSGKDFTNYMYSDAKSEKLTLKNISVQSCDRDHIVYTHISKEPSLDFYIYDIKSRKSRDYIEENLVYNLIPITEAQFLTYTEEAYPGIYLNKKLMLSAEAVGHWDFNKMKGH